MCKPLAFLMAALVGASTAPKFDTAKIEQLTGAKGSLNEKEGVFRVSYPRTDLHVTAAGVHLTPPMGLTAWAAFTKIGKHTAVMGDMVLTEDQVNPAMSAALDNGLTVTALHNHFFWEQPRVMFMHIGGMGDEGKLAAAVGKVFEAMKRQGPVPEAGIDPATTTFDPKKIEAVLGRKGEMANGVYKVTVGRETKMFGASSRDGVTRAVGGHTMGNAMGVNTWAAFAGSDERAVVDGDFAMLEGELQNVLKALRHAGINIVAIHQHMTGENPRVMFLHYWGVGRTEDLAKGLAAALEQTRS
jgi:hypothetical protein